jgi:hypothetical protein
VSSLSACLNLFHSPLLSDPVFERGSKRRRAIAIDSLTGGLFQYATDDQGSRAVLRALEIGGQEVLDRIVKKMCEPVNGIRFSFFPFINSLKNVSQQNCSGGWPMVVELQLRLIIPAIYD